MHKDKLCEKRCDLCGSAFYRDKRNTWAHWAKARFCSRTCSAIYGGEKKQQQTPTLSSAFWAKVEKGQDGDCWKWLGCTDKDGYGLLTFRKKQLRAARVAVTISGKPMRDEDQACHSCGNNWCCNPSHIYAGTPIQNNADKIAHGTHKAGSQVYCAVLDEIHIPDIRASNLSNATLGRIYGVSASAICHVKRRKTWRHVP